MIPLLLIYSISSSEANSMDIGFAVILVVIKPLK